MHNQQNGPALPTRLRRLGLMLVLAAAAPVWADTLDTFFITASVAEQYDDNLFRLPGDIDPQPLIGRSSASEYITTTSVMFNVNKAYSLQRFELQAGISDHRYRNFSYLGFLAKSYKGVWHWSLTPALHGNLLAERSQTGASFSDYRGYNKSNVVTQDRKRLDAELELGAAWHLLGGLTRSQTANAESPQGENDSRSDSAELGLSYSFPSGTRLRYIARTATGEYINRRDPVLFGMTDTGFADNEHTLSIERDLGGKTKLDARIAYFSRQHDHYAARDFDGITGGANINWLVTGQTQVRAGYSRQLASDQNFYSSYTETDRFFVAPRWQIGDKTALNLRYEIARRDYAGAIAQTSANGRSDTLRTAMIGIDWNPVRDLVLSASLQKDRRDSNLPGLDFDSNSCFVSAQISF